jgi:hypothetical protein
MVVSKYGVEATRKIIIYLWQIFLLKPVTSDYVIKVNVKYH